MKIKKVERKLYKEFEDISPNNLDSILSKVNAQEKVGFIEKIGKILKSTPLVFTAYATSAVFLFIALLPMFQFLFFDTGSEVYSLIAIDVNPSIELYLDKNDIVESIISDSNDINDVINEIKLENVHVDVAFYAIIGIMVSNGYLNEIQNSLLISIDTRNNEYQSKLRNNIVNIVNNSLYSSSFEGSIIMQTLIENSEIRRIKADNEISLSRASLIYRITEFDPTVNESSLTKLSINELNILIQSKEYGLNDVQNQGEPSTQKYISQDAALDMIMQDLNISIGDIIYFEIEIDEENGFIVYEVELETSQGEYEYLIRAIDGLVLEFNFDPEYDGEEFLYSNIITEEELIILILNHSGVYDESLIIDIEIDLDYDDTIYVYEVEFETFEYAYSYKINAVNSQMISYSIEGIDD